MQALPKEYNFAEIERQVAAKWEETGIYHFDWTDKTRIPFTIDTPPPYPSGELHMGNVLNWTYFDIVARSNACGASTCFSLRAGTATA